MTSLFEILLRPEFVISAVVLIGGAFLAMSLTARRFGRVKKFKAEKAEVDSQHPKVTFADIAGLDDAIAELREVKEYLADPERFKNLGAEMPRGILLYGPPGCGKTLLARALAGEAGVPFYFVSAASFVEKFVGLGAARVRELFEEAKRHAPCIVFIDELDAVGRQRSGMVAGEREFDNTLNQLLVELDGFTGNSGVLLLGATNRPELMDQALLRPGRFDRRVQIDQPDRHGREAILRLHASKRPFSRHVDWGEIAASTPGLTAAELANIVNEASLLAARRHREKISIEDVEESVTRMVSGTKATRVMREEDKRIVAYHEAGHALLALRLRGVKPPPRISLVARTGNFNKSVWADGSEKEVSTQRDLMAQVIVLLGGRAAEVSVFGEPSTRAEDDLKDAAALARSMVRRWAMTGRLELAGSGDLGNPLSDDGSGEQIRKLLATAEQAAMTILKDNESRLRAIAEALVMRETMSITEVARLTNLWGWRQESDGASVTPLRSVL